MSGEYVGGFTVGAAIPIALTAVATANATATAALLPAQARLAGAIQAAAAVTISPPSIAAVATLAAAAAASIQAALTGPTVGASAGVAAELVAELGGIVAALQAQLAVIAQLQGILATAGVHLYLLEGHVGGMSGDLSNLLDGGIPGGSGPNQPGLAVVLVGADDGAINALRAVFAI
jgi:hypothetical protein